MPAAALAVHGPLAAAMERLVDLAASALRAPFAFVMLTGHDRRCFAAGPAAPRWTMHDAGAFWRSGIVERITGEPVERRDLLHDLDPVQVAIAAELGIGSLIGVPIVAQGTVLGVFCAADPSATLWNDDDVDMLERFAAAAATDLALRHSLAEHEAHERQRKFDADHDALTGLANRGALLDRLRFALARPLSPSTAADGASDIVLDPAPEDLVAVFFIDVDGFRRINERFGHRVGDQLLVALGRRLVRVAGQQATVARLGGDEFAVLVERVDAADSAEELAERFRDTLRRPILVGGEEITLSVSVGMALTATQAELPEHVLRGADLAMTRAKRSTTSDSAPRPVLFDWEIATAARVKRRLQDELRSAVEGEQFVLRYLPVVELASGRITGVEALLRWQHPTRGLLSPHEFLGVVDELEIASEVGRWVLREACHQTRQWNLALPKEEELAVSVNLSARQFNSPAFLDDVSRAIKVFGLSPESLVLEVNERVVAQDLERTSGALTGLRALGPRVYLDDFGAGISPLSYLQRLPLDGVKVDQLLVERMDRDGRALRVVRSVVGLAREFGLEIVAEGVTSVRHLRVLREMGCTHGQGQLFSLPVEAEQVTALLRERPW